MLFRSHFGYSPRYARTNLFESCCRKNEEFYGGEIGEQVAIRRFRASYVSKLAYSYPCKSNSQLARSQQLL